MGGTVVVVAVVVAVVVVIVATAAAVVDAAAVAAAVAVIVVLILVVSYLRVLSWRINRPKCSCSPLSLSEEGIEIKESILGLTLFFPIMMMLSASIWLNKKNPDNSLWRSRGRKEGRSNDISDPSYTALYSVLYCMFKHKEKEKLLVEMGKKATKQ